MTDETMTPRDEVLLDAPMLPDPDAKREMSAVAAPQEVTDADVEGSRILIVKRALAPAGDGAAVELTCSFQPAPGTRFVSARVMVMLRTPVGEAFIDIAPTEIKEPVKVTIDYDADGKISVGKENIANAEIGGSEKRGLEYNSYICFVRGSGAGSRRAQWDFDEDPHLRGGIGLQQVLAMTVPKAAAVQGSLTVSATLAKSGLLGAARDLVLGRSRPERMIPIVLYDPAAT
jgi:hypothetical protein